MGKGLLLASVMAILPGVASAAPIDSLSEALGIKSVRLESGKAGRITWEQGQLLANGDLFFQELVITGESGKTSIYKAVLSPDTIQAEAVRISGKEDAATKTGEVILRRVVLSGPGAYVTAFAPHETCKAGAVVDPQMKTRVEFEMLSATPPDFPGPDGHYGRHGPEKISIEKGSFGLKNGEVCIALQMGELTGLGVTSAAGDTGAVARLSYLSPAPYTHELSASGVTIADPAGKTVLQLASGSLRGSASEAFVLAFISESGRPQFPGIKSIFAGPAGADFSMDGLRVSEGVIDRGGQSLPALVGDLSGRIDFDGDRIALTHEAHLEGLYDMDLALEMNVAEKPAEAAAMLAEMRNGDKRIETLGRLSLVSGTFGYRDMGAKATAEDMTGSKPSDMVRFAERFAGKLPESLRGPIFDWLAATADGEGRVNFRPAAPVDMAALGVAALMSPAMLVSQSGMRVSGSYDRTE
ncbi:hypothetical protein ACEUZ9_002842 [Paracoccus litorisediminis]|uniref:hypothetical protein n=1 Tax=Paracoccus litorisediminis TaxID=2006130 RepID=UPI003734B0A2